MSGREVIVIALLGGIFVVQAIALIMQAILFNGFAAL